MFPSKWSEGLLLFLCMSWTMVHGLSTSTTPRTRAEPASSTASTVSVSVETKPTQTSVSTETIPSQTSSISVTGWSTTQTPPQVPNAKNFTATHQTENSITLQWVPPGSNYSYTLKFEERTENVSGGFAVINYTVNKLEPTRSYNITLHTVSFPWESSGVSIKALTAPANVAGVSVIDQSNSSISLQWVPVKNVHAYWVEYRDSAGGTNTTRVEEHGEQNHTVVNHTVSHLRSATSYNFTIYSQLENVSSSGSPYYAVTAPLAVMTMVKVTRTLREVVLSWSRDGDSTYLLLFNGTIIGTPNERWPDLDTRTVSDLKEGTAYNYSITASYREVNSATFQGNTVTTINCSAASWRVTSSTIVASIAGAFTDVSAANGSSSQSEFASDPLGNWELTGLYPGATYQLSVNYKTLLQCQHNLTLPPPDISAQCEYESSDAILLHWALPAGVWTGVEVNVTGRSPMMAGEGGVLRVILHGFQPAKSYQVSTCLLSGQMRSTMHILDCPTDPRGVIAGSVVSVLVVLVLVALGVFFWHRRSRPAPQCQRRTESKPTTHSNTYRPIPVDMFENHIRQLSQDDNRGFSEEYESFNDVGTEQTRHAAIAPDNKVKNRFTNVLPYDWSRVTLCTLIEWENCNYINASYLPGYRGSKEYIAAQGPLAETLDDFWRMVWEQGVKVIAMVTNCTEGGRAKCEQYWPLDYTPCLYGDLLVTSTSEQRQQSWTIRTFNIKNRATSQERSVQHFHFQAWPDHNVPDGTGPLLQFRALLRQHVMQEGGSAPILVHCSAGVGRTGTLVALDVLLQQMEVEGTVNVASFVHKMRLSRPLMVQTESQYVFLHRCILEAMQRRAAKEEPAYQNWNMIYANATALQELPPRC